MKEVRYKKKRRFSEVGKKNISNGVRKTFKNGRVVWNKGLTKETDERVKKNTEGLSKNKERSMKISLKKIGVKRKPFSIEWRKNLSKDRIKRGLFKRESNPFWKGGTMDNKTIHISKFHELKPFEWRLLRKKILIRDNYICKICGKKGNCIDHIVPYRVSKDNSESNLQVLCRKCHAKKDMLWEEEKCVLPYT